MSFKAIFVLATLLACTLAVPAPRDLSIDISVSTLGASKSVAGTLHERANNAQCDLPSGKKVAVAGVEYCAKYLAGLGKQKCEWKGTGEGAIGMCEWDGAVIGIGATKAGSVSMKCTDAAVLAKDILKQCKDNGKVKGYAFVPANEYTSTGFKPNDETALIVVEKVPS